MGKFCNTCGTSLWEGQLTCPVCDSNKRWKRLEEENKRIRAAKESNKEVDQNDDGPCFVATVAFEDANCKEVNILREFRDKILLNNSVGKRFVKWYYSNGESLATWISIRPITKEVIKKILRIFVKTLTFVNR